MSTTVTNKKQFMHNINNTIPYGVLCHIIPEIISYLEHINFNDAVTSLAITMNIVPSNFRISFKTLCRFIVLSELNLYETETEKLTPVQILNKAKTHSYIDLSLYYLKGCEELTEEEKEEKEFEFMTFSSKFAIACNLLGLLKYKHAKVYSNGRASPITVNLCKIGDKHARIYITFRGLRTLMSNWTPKLSHVRF